jgi:hypothetical protein
MHWANSITIFFRSNNTAILIGLAAAVFVLLIVSFILLLRLSALAGHVRRSSRPVDGVSQGEFEQLVRSLDRLEERVAGLAQRASELDDKLARAVQRVALVRFDAFADVGGGQSFALALLDRDQSGVVLSNLYGRSDSRMYAKEIAGGQSQHALTDEEQQAIRKAGAERE